MRLLLSLTNAVGAGRMRQATRELVKAYIHGLDSAALDDVFGTREPDISAPRSDLLRYFRHIKRKKHGEEKERIAERFVKC